MNANPDLLKALNGLVKTFGHCNRLLSLRLPEEDYQKLSSLPELVASR